MLSRKPVSLNCVIRVRAISVGFAVLALAVFKPFGLETWQWEAYVHLLVMWILGVDVCLITETILRFIVRIPRSLEQGATYIIRRNLWFQLINTPLVSLMICLYRHFLLSDRVPANRLSWGNFLETFIIHLSNLLYIEAVGNYVKVYHLRNGQVRTDMLRATSRQLEGDLHAYPMIVRCHRAFLVNLGQVEQIISHSGSMQLVIRHCQESIPVSRSNMAQVKHIIKLTIG